MGVSGYEEHALPPAIRSALCMEAEGLLDEASDGSYYVSDPLRAEEVRSRLARHRDGWRLGVDPEIYVIAADYKIDPQPLVDAWRARRLRVRDGAIEVLDPDAAQVWRDIGLPEMAEV